MIVADSLAHGPMTLPQDVADAIETIERSGIGVIMNVTFTNAIVVGDNLVIRNNTFLGDTTIKAPT